MKENEIQRLKDEMERENENYEVKLSAIRERLKCTEKKIYEQVEKEYE